MKNAVLQVRLGQNTIRGAAKLYGLNDKTVGNYCKKWANLRNEDLKTQNENENVSWKFPIILNSLCSFNLFVYETNLEYQIQI